MTQSAHAITHQSSLELRPMREAPVSAGKPFGPCLIGPNEFGAWTTGRWNGAGWFGEDGFPLHNPLLWALLPPPPLPAAERCNSVS